MPQTIIRERGEREKKNCRARSDSDHHPGQQQQQQQQPQQIYGFFFCFVLYPPILLAYKLLIFFLNVSHACPNSFPLCVRAARFLPSVYP